MSYMPVAVSYRSRVTTAASAVAAGRIRGFWPGSANPAGEAERLADAVLERRRLPAELLLRAGRVGGGVPEQELELTARDERWDAEARGQRVPEGRGGTGDRHRHHRRHAAPARDADDRLGQLLQRDVPVGQDVALAVPAALGCEQVAGGGTAHVHHAQAARGEGRKPPARHRLEELLVDRPG